MTTIIYFGGGKGGSSKTTTAHLTCLGAILRNQPAAYVLTDPERKVRGDAALMASWTDADPKTWRIS